jgi:RimJ/RimL family protein N-acetyltransferase
MYSSNYAPQIHVRLNRARAQYVKIARQRKYSPEIFVPLETPRLMLTFSQEQRRHSTGFAGDRISGKERETDGEACWIIYHKDAPLEHIGSISLFEFTPVDAKVASAMLAYTLLETHRGKGYMTEALSEIVRFAFESMGLQRIEARIRVTNDASRSVVHRLGFKNVGCVRQGKWALGGDSGIQIVETDVWMLKKSDWEAHDNGLLIVASL